MCTLSVIPRENGYLLGMNRDERIARGAGLPPEVREFADAKAIYPTDGDARTSTSGTWIGANEHGIAIALLNWNDLTSPAPSTKKSRSRGVLIPALIGSSGLTALQVTLAALSLEGILPFRLFGVFPCESRIDKGKIGEGTIDKGTIGEWRWNSVRLEFVLHRWEAGHWFSSSLSHSQAESLRGAACRDAWSQLDAGSVSWLRRLHASHASGSCASPGAFSVCVHRPEVRTLSYSEIDCTSAKVRMEHFTGSPCVAVGNGIGKGTALSRAVTGRQTMRPLAPEGICSGTRGLRDNH